MVFVEETIKMYAMVSIVFFNRTIRTNTNCSGNYYVQIKTIIHFLWKIYKPKNPNGICPKHTT